jgi:hypothetical protein
MYETAVALFRPDKCLKRKKTFPSKYDLSIMPVMCSSTSSILEGTGKEDNFN